MRRLGVRLAEVDNTHHASERGWTDSRHFLYPRTEPKTMNQSDRNWARRLVQEVKRRECLYDSSHPDHKDRQKIDQEWDEVAQLLESSADIVRRRWQNLRGSFSKAVQRKSRETGTETKSHKFYLMDQMSFLIKHMNPVNPWKTGIEIGPDYEGKQELPSPTGSASEMNAVVDDFYPASPSSGSSARENLRLKRKHSLSVEEAMIAFLQSQETEDEDLCFFKGLLPHIKELNKKRKRSFLLLVISELVKSLSEQETENAPTLVLDVTNVS